MISAAHLHSREPWNEDYREAEAFHLSGATRGLRSAISMEFKTESAEALFGCSTLLYNQAWSSKGEEYDRSNIEDRELDFLVRLGTGLKDIIFDRSIWPGVWNSEIFGEDVAFRPVVPITECAKKTVFPDQFKNAFQQEYHSIQGQMNDANHFMVCMLEFHRLIPPLCVIQLGHHGVDIVPLEPAIVRYLNSWPILLSKEFIHLMKQGDIAASLVFYHFYCAVTAAMSEKYWWAQRRPRYVSKIIRSSLEEKGVVVLNLLSDLGSNPEPALEIDMP
jgi:hypothetical protein